MSNVEPNVAEISRRLAYLCEHIASLVDVTFMCKDTACSIIDTDSMVAFMCQLEEKINAIVNTFF